MSMPSRHLYTEKHNIVTEIPKLNELMQILSGQGLDSEFADELISQIISYDEKVKKDLNRKRQAEGIEAARAQGIHLGRPPKKLPENYADIIELWEHGKICFEEALALTGMKKTTFYKYLNSHRKYSTQYNGNKKQEII